MSEFVTGITFGGAEWTPAFVTDINQKTCIGCGRCFKVCGRSVMTLQGITEDGDLVGLDDDEEILRKVMTVTDPGACIGCGACGRVCGKNCQRHGPS